MHVMKMFDLTGKVALVTGGQLRKTHGGSAGGGWG